MLVVGRKRKEAVGGEELATNGEKRSQAMGVLDEGDAAKRGLLWWLMEGGWKWRGNESEGCCKVGGGR